MVPALLPGAVWRPVSYRSAAGVFPSTPLGWILHVVVGNGSPWGTFEHAPAGSRRFSTAWVAKDGSSEQYTELGWKSWAQGAGNPLYWAFETEGYPTEPLTEAQITTLATWHNALGADDALAQAPGQRGIGTHYMGGTAWGGHTCPDPVAGAGPRSRQRAAIIARAKSLRTIGPSGGFGTGVGGSGTYTPLAPIATPPAPSAPIPIAQEDDDMLLTFDTDQGGHLVTDNGVTALNGQEWNLLSRLKAKNVAAGANPDAYAGVDQFLPAEIDVIRAVLARVAPAAPASTPGAIDYAALAKAVNDDAATRRSAWH